MSPQSPVGASNELYGHPEMILRFDFSLIIVSLGDPAVADFSKHYVEIHIASLSRGFLGLLASTSLLDHTLLLVAPESRCIPVGCVLPFPLKFIAHPV